MLTVKEAIEQLGSLLQHCEDMRKYSFSAGSSPWDRDVAALELAMDVLTDLDKRVVNPLKSIVEDIEDLMQRGAPPQVDVRSEAQAAFEVNPNITGEDMENMALGLCKQVTAYGVCHDNLFNCPLFVVEEGDGGMKMSMPCHNASPRIKFADGTIIRAIYEGEVLGCWHIEVERKGIAAQSLDKSSEPGSDVFRIHAEYLAHEFIYK